MAPLLDQLGKGAHVGIIRLRSLGDCVLTTPAIRILKQHRSDLRIGVAVEPRFAAVFEDNPDVSDILNPSIPAIRRFAPRLALNLHGGTRSLQLTLAGGARFRAGFAHYRYSLLYNVRIPRAQEILGVERKMHTAEHLASAMFHLGVPQREIPGAILHASPPAATKPYAVIHALASASGKSWPSDRFRAVAAYIKRDMSLEPVFIGAPGEDLSAFAPYRTVTASLNDTKRLLAGASFFAGNDSGPAHMAAAFRIPGVVLFATSDPVVWAPWRTPAEAIVSPEGMAALPVEQVLRTIERLRVRA